MNFHKEATAAKLTDDIVVDILSRLTYRDFCRCKCAYKAWSAFSSDPDYCKKLPKKVTTGLLYQGHNNSAIPLVSLSQDDGEIDGILADVPHYEHLEFLDCCNGLVLCKYRSRYSSPHACRFIVCNPATREWRILPDTHPTTDDPHYVTILAFDPSWSPQFYIFNFHLMHHHGLILGTSKLEIFQSETSTWLVDDTLDLNTDAFGRDDFVHYDNGGDEGDVNWFWNCDYRVVDLDLERELVFLCDQKAKKLLSYNISTGKLNAIEDTFQWHHYYVYVPCYSQLPAQEPSVE
ncbi:F-box protein At5g07610 isoform X2 [Lolium perenne]|uniref:F-box protein At5g07610 isoform X2 n=1 Tax=Lolium perenne TaxID=4522 RepID=UPI0021F68605|nr:F-box protein At5g07610-like isoform X2 [Lolium perenne]